MMDFVKRTVLGLAVLAGTASCMSDVREYDGESGVYFSMRENTNVVNADTLYLEKSSLPFIVTQSTDSLFLLKVKILGPVSDRDRKFLVSVVDDRTTARPEDYDALQDYYTVPAGAVYASVPIMFHRTPSLKGDERVLCVELKEGGDFKLPIRKWRNSSVEYVDVISHSISVSDKYVQLPGYSVGHFGPFSEKKMELILEICEQKLSYFNQKLPITVTRAMGQKLDRYLSQMKAKGTPVLEEDGTPMISGSYLY